MSNLDREGGTRRKVDRCKNLTGIDDLPDRCPDRDCLAGVAGEAVQDAVNRRSDRVIVEMSFREFHGAFRGLQLCLGLSHGFGLRADHHHPQIGLGRLVLELCLSDREIGLEDLLFGRLAPGKQGPETIGQSSRPVEGNLGLLDRKFIDPSFLGPREGLQEVDGGLQSIARRGLLGEVGKGHRLVELNDGLTLLDRLPLLHKELVNVTFDGGSQRREFRGDGFGASEALNRSDQRPEPRRFRLDRDMSPLALRVMLFLFFSRVRTAVTSGEPERGDDRKHP